MPDNDFCPLTADELREQVLYTIEYLQGNHGGISIGHTWAEVVDIPWDTIVRIAKECNVYITEFGGEVLIVHPRSLIRRR